MDTSRQYIKMCNCPEIQGQRPKGGFDLACWVTRHLYISKSFDCWSMIKTPHIWLPRQDQIQEMFKGYDAFILAGKFDGEMENLITGNPSKWTMEQLWLAFYMWEKHKKTWDGEKWTKEKEAMPEIEIVT